MHYASTLDCQNRQSLIHRHDGNERAQQTCRTCTKEHGRGCAAVGCCTHLIHVLDADALLIHIVLEDELLQVEEGPLVPSVLPHLLHEPKDCQQPRQPPSVHTRASHIPTPAHLLSGQTPITIAQVSTGPQVKANKAPHLDTGCPDIAVGVGARAVHAHVRLYHVLHHKGLLQDGAIHDLCLDRQLHFEPARVGLCPYEAGIHQLDLQEANTITQLIRMLRLICHATCLVRRLIWPLLKSIDFLDCMAVHQHGLLLQHHMHACGMAVNKCSGRAAGAEGGSRILRLLSASP